MGVLAELGLNTADGAVMLIDPPDSIMPEAGAMKPRPSTASSLLTAEPTTRIAWWPLLDQLTPAAMGRLAWMVSIARGEAWLVLDPGDPDSPTTDDVRAVIGPGGLHAREERPLSTGQLALRLG
jgi:hypothetical protein